MHFGETYWFQVGECLRRILDTGIKIRRSGYSIWARLKRTAVWDHLKRDAVWSVFPSSARKARFHFLFLKGKKRKARQLCARSAFISLLHKHIENTYMKRARYCLDALEF
jgi:hypothetical protein